MMLDFLAQVAHVSAQIVRIVGMTRPSQFLQQVAEARWVNTGSGRAVSKARPVFDRCQVHHLPGAGDPPVGAVKRNIAKAQQRIVTARGLPVAPKMDPGSGQEFG